MSNFFEIPVNDEQYGDEQELIGEVQEIPVLTDFLEKADMPQE